MPEIAAVSAVAPAAPAAPAAPVAASTAVASTAQAAEGSAQDFLSQLKAALKTLAGVVSTSPTSTTPAAVPADAGVTSTDGAPGVADDHQPDTSPQSANAQTDVSPDLLAALGALMLPTPQTPLPTPAPAAAATALAGQMTQTLVAGNAPLVQQLLTQSQTPARTAPQPPLNAEPQNPANAEPQPGAQVATDSPLIQTGPAAENASPKTAKSVTALDSETVAPVAQSVSNPAPVMTAAQTTAATPAPQHVPAPGQPVATATVGAVLPHAQKAGAGLQQSTDSGSGGSSMGQQAPAAQVADAKKPAAAAEPSVDQTVVANAAVANAAPAVSTNLPPSVSPGDVVAQIAHQANLYQLPGNKGVRIQLHPEDLGGVEVTVRYASGGALELHINVEHATTGALVQQGWTQLRDALATQGISADRLVMSITAPANASSLDLSANGGGGSYRSDPGLAGFAQQQGDQSSGQQRDNTDQPRSSAGWTTTGVAQSASDETPRVVTTSASSRIDYRV